MSTYADTLRSMLEISSEYATELTRARGRAATEAERLSREVEKRAERERVMLARLDEMLGRARQEGVWVDASRGDDVSSADPIALARQLLDRLEAGLDELLHTRRALAAEEHRLADEAHKRADAEAERHRRQEAEVARQWKAARRGNRVLFIVLAAAPMIGIVAGLAANGIAASAAVIAGGIGVGIALQVPSGLEPLAVKRVTGVAPTTPAAPPRERRLGAAGFGFAILAATASGVVLVATGPIPLALLVVGAIGLAAIWLLPALG